PRRGRRRRPVARAAGPRISMQGPPFPRVTRLHARSGPLTLARGRRRGTRVFLVAVLLVVRVPFEFVVVLEPQVHHCSTPHRSHGLDNLPVLRSLPSPRAGIVASTGAGRSPFGRGQALAPKIARPTRTIVAPSPT